MKKIVLTFGLISGAISAALMLGLLSFLDKIGFDKGAVIGYTAMVLSFLLIFFGIRSYRENVGGGEIRPPFLTCSIFRSPAALLRAVASS